MCRFQNDVAVSVGRSGIKCTSVQSMVGFETGRGDLCFTFLEEESWSVLVGICDILEGAIVVVCCLCVGVWCLVLIVSLCCGGFEGKARQGRKRRLQTCLKL